MALPKIILPDSEEQRIKTLRALYKDAQTGLRRVVAFGLYCFNVKAALPHGQFLPWLKTHCPDIAPRTVSSYTQLTSNVLDACGIKVADYLQIGSTLPICRNGKFLLMAEKKVPEAVKSLREKICSLVDGKSQRQLLLEFTQVDEDNQPKRGQLKGSKGLTKEQRLNARQREHAAFIAELKVRLNNLGDDCDELADAKHAGEPEVKTEAAELLPKVENFFRFLKSLA